MYTEIGVFSKKLTLDMFKVVTTNLCFLIQIIYIFYNRPKKYTRKEHETTMKNVLKDKVACELHRKNQG